MRKVYNIALSKETASVETQTVKESVRPVSAKEAPKLKSHEMLNQLVECVKKENNLGHVKGLSHSLEMENLYDFLDFIERLKKRLQTVAPLRSSRRKEELNFYHSVRPDSAASFSSVASSAVTIPAGTRGKPKDIL